MENLNKNWLLILLVAVIFGTLGFLVGRATGHHGPPPHKRWIMEGNHPDSTELGIKVEVNETDNAETTEVTDTIVKDGKQIIIKEIRKVKK